MVSYPAVCQKSMFRDMDVMALSEDVSKYIIVTPVKDEERYVARTLQSVTEQTVRPLCWVLVDDGSTDRTPDIIRAYLDNFEWISYIRIERTAQRLLGSAEIRAFSIGYESVRHLEHEYVVKLDADLALPADYFEQMLCRFRDNASLGIASGLYLEEKKGSWSPVPLPQYHAAGAAKMVRVACFHAIGGFPLLPGWDTVDEIKALTRGWETGHFPDVQFYHLKSEGSASGSLRTSFFHGEIYYVCGGSALFFLGKLLHRMMADKPLLLAGALLLFGYLYAVLTRRPKLVSLHEETYYKRLLNRRIAEQLTSRLSFRV
jgi:biofilm PGA synthesis N-glycosyltransferase PgaC